MVSLVTMSNEKKIQNFSVNIKSFCDNVDQALKDYQYYTDKIVELDKTTQDYLHILELGKLNYKGRATLATKLQKVRKDRRFYKDSCEILQPLIDFINDSKNKNLINLLRQVQGDTKKVETRINGERVYYSREISQDEFDGLTGRITDISVKKKKK